MTKPMTAPRRMAPTGWPKVQPPYLKSDHFTWEEIQATVGKVIRAREEVEKAQRATDRKK